MDRIEYSQVRGGKKREREKGYDIKWAYCEIFQLASTYVEEAREKFIYRLHKWMDVKENERKKVEKIHFFFSYSVKFSTKKAQLIDNWNVFLLFFFFIHPIQQQTESNWAESSLFFHTKKKRKLKDLIFYIISEENSFILSFFHLIAHMCSRLQHCCIKVGKFC